jgi:integrase
MAIYKRGAVWWVHFVSPNGERVRHSAKTGDKAQAQEYHDKLKAELWRQQKLGEKPDRKFEEAAVKYLKEKDQKSSLSEDARHISFWLKHFRGRGLRTITRQEVADILDQKEGTPATKNRYMATLRGMLNLAWREWEWISGCPKFRSYKGEKARIRWITKEDAGRLLDALPSRLKAPAEFALLTGLRQANVFGLRWEQINMQTRTAWVRAEDAKAKKAIPVPLNQDAVDILKGQIGKHLELVFGDVKLHSDEWKRVLKRAGIKDFRWHDLRHTWASWHMQAGTPLHVLKELGGWSDMRMVLRYAHLSQEHLSAYAANVGTSVTQQQTVKTQAVS